MQNKINSTPGEVETVCPKQGVWQTYGVTNGLPGGVQCVLQDHQGYLWRLSWETNALSSSGRGRKIVSGKKGVIHET